VMTLWHCNIRKQIAQSMSSHYTGMEQEDTVSMNIYAAQEIGDSEVELFRRFAILKSSNNNNFIHFFTKGALEFGQYPLEVTPFQMSASMQSRSSGIWKDSSLYTQISLWNEMFIHTKWTPETIENLIKGMFLYEEYFFLIANYLLMYAQ